MGSFCSSCFVTRQTIEDGDPVRIFFIRDASGLMTKDIQN